MTDSRNGFRIQCRSRAILFAAGVAMALFLAAAPCRAGQNLIFIVDASASMADPLSSETKIAAAREALIDAFKTVSPEFLTIYP